MDKINAASEKWDYLVILDACRYDYFERMYGEYLEGELSKRTSAGSSTNEWRDVSFPDFYYDIVYITGNPQLSASSKVYGYCAGDHFGTIHEIWKTHWDARKGTVAPDVLTRAALDIIAKGEGKRHVIHYLQPHAPYLSLDEIGGYSTADINKARSLAHAEGGRAGSAFRAKLIKRLARLLKGTRVLTNQPQWMLRKLFGMPPAAPMESAWRYAGPVGLRIAYEENLRTVLKQVAVNRVSDAIGNYLQQPLFFAQTVQPQKLPEIQQMVKIRQR